MNSENLWAWILGGGSLGAAIGAITKYLLDRRKQIHDQSVVDREATEEWNSKELARLEARILKLEKDYEDCLDKRAAVVQQLGITQGEVQGLKVLLTELQKSNRQTAVQVAAQAAADQTAEKAVQKVEQAVQTAVAKATETTLPIVEQIKTDVKDIKDHK